MTDASFYDALEDALPADDQVADGLIRGAAYPLLQWVNGDGKRRTDIAATGGWFWPLDRIPRLWTPPAEWETDTITFDEGGDLTGYPFQVLHFAVLSKRKDFFVIDEASNRRMTYASYDEAARYGKAKSRVRYLGLVCGAEEAGLVMLTIKSVNAGHLESAMQTFFNSVYKPANEAFEARQRAKGAARVRMLPTYALYVAIKAGPRVEAKEGFTSKITPPILAFDPKAQGFDPVVYAGENMLAPAHLKIASELFDEAKDWAKASIDRGDPYGEPEGFAPADVPASGSRQEFDRPRNGNGGRANGQGQPFRGGQRPTGGPRSAPSGNYGGAGRPEEPPPWLDDEA